MRLKKVGDWIHYITEGGQPFYYNDKNGEFQWEPPDSLGGSKLITKKSNPTAIVDDSNSNKSSNQASRSNEMIIAPVTTLGTSTASVMEQVETAPITEELNQPVDEYEWHPYKDADTGALFWYNHITGVSQWECPYDPPVVDNNDNTLTDDNNAYFDEHDHDEHDAQVVHDTDDLGI